MARAIKTEVYKDAFAIVNTKKSVEKKFVDKSDDKFNVLFIGIDSISRLNFIRSMPTTYDYLKRNEWIEMKIFNKVGDNTLPNLVAILTGHNESYVQENCSPKLRGGLEKCKYLWNDFDEANYVTAYAEDSMEITTFNFYNKGFSKQPTDYYFRPFALAAEKNLPTTRDKPWYIQCLGHRHYADYIYNYGVDFAEKFKNQPHFGFFWTNSFSHDNIK